ncbi:MAG: glycosyltransferase family 9 protein, partial [Bacteroidota bacterium]
GSLMLKKRLKILVVRFSSIGDMVLTTPIVRALKEQRQAEVHYLCKTRFREILQANPYLDRIYGIEKNIGEVLPELRLEQYDYLVDLHKNWRSLHLRLALRCPYLSFDKINVAKWLMVRLKWNRLPPVHLVDRYWTALQPLGIQNDGRGLDYFIASQDRIGNEELVKWFAQIDRAPSPYVAFAIGAAHATKQLPADLIAKICSQMTAPIVLLGGKREEALGAAIRAQWKDRVINTCGQLTLGQSAAFIEKATKVISPDTGMMHIAAALGKEIIVVWGNTIPDFGMYPYLPVQGPQYHSFEIKNLSCRPCSKIGFTSCPKGHFHCMNRQDARAIAHRAKISVDISDELK